MPEYLFHSFISAAGTAFFWTLVGFLIAVYRPGRNAERFGFEVGRKVFLRAWAFTIAAVILVAVVLDPVLNERWRLLADPIVPIVVAFIATRACEKRATVQPALK